MAEDKKEGSSFLLPNAGAIAIVLSLTGLVIIGQGVFIDERPKAQESIDNDSGYAQDIDARLWQDPFAAIKKDLEESSSKTTNLVLSKNGSTRFDIKVKGRTDSEEDAKHKLLQLFLNWGKPSQKDVTVIVAMVSGGPYSETQEMRIRRRYALVSALSTLRFTPKDAEHIGYFKPNEPRSESGLANYELPDAIPFEWFDPPEHIKHCKKNNNISLCNKVLVLWLDDARFGEKPIEKIREILWQVSPDKIPNSSDVPNFDYAVIGPNDSEQLRVLAKGMSDDHKKNESSYNPAIRFYSANATAEDARIFEGIDRDSVLNKKLHLVRTVADDRLVTDKPTFLF